MSGFYNPLLNDDLDVPAPTSVAPYAAQRNCIGQVLDDRVRAFSRGRTLAGDNNTSARPGRPSVAANHTASRSPQVPGNGYWDAFQRGKKLPDDWDEGDDLCRYDGSYAETFSAREAFTRGGETPDRANRGMTYGAGFHTFPMRGGRLTEEDEWEDRSRGMTQRDEDRSRGFARSWHANRPNSG